MSAAMERATSVDDLIGGFWRGLGQAAGMPRTDSEAAFQEFLKRIPSTANLTQAAAAAAAAGDSSSAAQALQQQVQQLTQAVPAAAAGSSSAVAPSSSVAALPSLVATAPLTDLVTSAVGGIPRVPSLDFLRQIMVSNQQFPPPSSTPPIIKPDPGAADALKGAAAAAAASAGLTAPMVMPAALPAGYPLPAMGLTGLTPTDIASLTAAATVGSNISAALQAVPGFQPGNPLAAAALNPAAAAAAALQLGQLGQLSRLANPVPDKEVVEKAEFRRARRMLSNRESARRSRRRKQEHLSKLEVEKHHLEDERREIETTLEGANRRTAQLEDENRRLRDENERLRDELRFLRTEIKDRNGYGNHGTAAAGRRGDDDDARAAKRQQRAADKEANGTPNGGAHEAHGAQGGKGGRAAGAKGAAAKAAAAAAAAKAAEADETMS